MSRVRHGVGTRTPEGARGDPLAHSGAFTPSLNPCPVEKSLGDDPSAPTHLWTRVRAFAILRSVGDVFQSARTNAPSLPSSAKGVRVQNLILGQITDLDTSLIGFEA